MQSIIVMQAHMVRCSALAAIIVAVVACGENAEGTLDAGTPDAGVLDAAADHTGVSGQQALLKAPDGLGVGTVVALSATGDALAVLGFHAERGVPLVFGRSGNTWSTQASLGPST